MNATLLSARRRADQWLGPLIADIRDVETSIDDPANGSIMVDMHPDLAGARA